MKKRVSFMVEADLLDRLRWIKSRTGLSESEQVRRGIRMWVESGDWSPSDTEPLPPDDRGAPPPTTGRNQGDQ